jgi:hypothetical protein
MTTPTQVPKAEELYKKYVADGAVVDPGLGHW